jgi:hypothetical protein
MQRPARKWVSRLREEGPSAVVGVEAEQEAASWEVCEMSENETPRTDLRARAVVSLKKKADFRTHLFVYTVVNAALVTIWVLTGTGFFWPMFPMVVWGIGIIFHAQDVYGRHEISEVEIRREMERMR